MEDVVADDGVRVGGHHGLTALVAPHLFRVEDRVALTVASGAVHVQHVRNGDAIEFAIQPAPDRAGVR